MTAEINTIQTLRTEITDSISHELKTPVASINSFAKLLLEEDLSEDKKRKCLDYIVKESDKLSDLIKSTLLMSKIDQLEIVTEKKPYNIGRQIKECAIAMENEWSAKGIDLTADTLDVIYEGNEGLMESLWQNLLSNAIKFTLPNGRIKIKMIVSITEQNVIIPFL